MDSFNIIVLAIAVIFLIIGLTSFALLLKKAKTTSPYPKAPAACPDYWDVSMNPDGTYWCKVPADLNTTDNLAKLKTYNNGAGTISSSDITTTNGSTYYNFSSSNWSGATGLCNKYKWAKTNSYTLSTSVPTSWDGISNITAPC
jgi:hypothetical protein